MALAFVTTRISKNSIAALAGLVESHDTLLDLPMLFMRDDDTLDQRIATAMEQHEHLIVACSFCTPQRDHVAQLVRRLRTLSAVEEPRVHYVAGGPHPSGDPEGTLALGFDTVVVGEGEETFPALLVQLLDDDDMSEVRGLVHRQGEETVHTGRAARVGDLDAYPPFAPGHRRFGPIEITRGCPYACAFCQTPRLFGSRPRHRSPEVVAEWTRIAHSHGIPFMRFVTPNALAYGSPNGRQPNLAAVEELLLRVGEVVGRERVYLGSFPSEVRPEMVTDEAISLIKRLAGNRNITIGAQSGSPRLLEKVRPGHTVEDVHRACEIVLRHGMVPNVDVIFGLPGETESDRILTVRLIEKLSDQGARIRTHAFIPLAGTPLSEAEPGVIGGDLDRLLGRLAREGKQHGARRGYSGPGHSPDQS